MRFYIYILILAPSFVFAQSGKIKQQIDENHVRIIVNQAVKEAKDELAKLQSKQLDLYKQEFDQRAKSVEQKLVFINWIIGIVGTLLTGGIIGLLWWVLVKTPSIIRERIEREVDFAVYKLDPRRWPINIPRNGFDTEHERLLKLKYGNLRSINGLDASCKEGITVYKANSDEDLDKLKKFMVKNR